AGYDAGVRYDERVERDMIAIPIGPRIQRFVTAASPDYFAKHGRPQHPNDLLEHDCLRFRFQSGVMPGWDFVRGDDVIRLSPPARLIGNRLAVVVDAAHGGLGIVHGFAEFILPSVAMGRLELVLEDWSERFPGAFLYYASRRHMPGPLRAFVDF